MDIAMFLAGFLFLFIIITNVVSVRFGNKIILDLDSDARLQELQGSRYYSAS